jgi:hypothetical protein
MELCCLLHDVIQLCVLSIFVALHDALQVHLVLIMIMTTSGIWIFVVVGVGLVNAVLLDIDDGCINQSINGLHQEDPILIDFIRDKMLEPPPILRNSLEDLNLVDYEFEPKEEHMVWNVLGGQYRVSIFIELFFSSKNSIKNLHFSKKIEKIEKSVYTIKLKIFYRIFR